MVFTSPDSIEGPRAFAERLAYGLVTRLFPAVTLHSDVLALAEELAGHHPFPLRMMKANVLSAERMDIEEYIEVESARHLNVVASPSLRQGVEGFVRGRDKTSS